MTRNKQQQMMRQAVASESYSEPHIMSHKSGNQPGRAADTYDD